MATEDMTEVENVIGKDKVSTSSSYLETLMTPKDSDGLALAVVGGPKTGKSSFIDALRGLDAYECDSAIRKKSSKEPVRNISRDNSGLVYWELPAPSILKYSEGEYKRAMDWAKYDMYVLVCDGNITDDDKLLAKLIKDKGQDLIVIRTKNDRLLDVYNKHSECEQTDEEIENQAYDDMIEKLTKANIEADKVYVVSSVPKENVKFLDFPLVLDSLIESAPAGHKKGIALAMGPHSETIISQKESALRDMVWQVALGSAVANLVPIAGTFVDVGLLSIAMKRFKHHFGVDKESVEKAIESYQLDSNRFSSATKAFLTLTLVALVSTFVQGMSLAYALNWCAVLCVVGVFFVGPINYMKTRQALNRMIDQCGEVSKDILHQVQHDPKISKNSRLVRVGTSNPYHRRIP